MSRVDDLRADYDRLGELLSVEVGSAAASLARERRIIGELLESLESPSEVPLVDDLASRRRSRTKPARVAAASGKSG